MGDLELKLREQEQQLRSKDELLVEQVQQFGDNITQMERINSDQAEVAQRAMDSMVRRVDVMRQERRRIENQLEQFRAKLQDAERQSENAKRDKTKKIETLEAMLRKRSDTHQTQLAACEQQKQKLKEELSRAKEHIRRLEMDGVENDNHMDSPPHQDELAALDESFNIDVEDVSSVSVSQNCSFDDGIGDEDGWTRVIPSSSTHPVSVTPRLTRQHKKKELFTKRQKKK